MLSLPIGSIGWVDLTVADCGSIRSFYERVVGWTSQPFEMEGYSDYCMILPAAETPAGASAMPAA